MMELFFAKTKLTVALMGVLLVGLGVAILANPVRTLELVTRLVGIACALSGLMMLVESARLEGGLGSVATSSLIVGGLPLALGVIIALVPGFFVSFLFTIIGVGVVLTGLGDISRARGLRRAAGIDAKTMSLIGAVKLACGLLIVFAPLVAASVVPILAGMSLVLDGISEIVLAVRM